MSEWVVEITDGLPHLKNMKPLVRCKDCKHNDGSCCDYSAVYTRPNGYCQWGERKEQDDA